MAQMTWLQPVSLSLGKKAHLPYVSEALFPLFILQFAVDDNPPPVPEPHRRAVPHSEHIIREMSISVVVR